MDLDPAAELLLVGPIDLTLSLGKNLSFRLPSSFAVSPQRLTCPPLDHARVPPPRLGLFSPSSSFRRQLVPFGRVRRRNFPCCSLRTCKEGIKRPVHFLCAGDVGFLRNTRKFLYTILYSLAYFPFSRYKPICLTCLSLFIFRSRRPPSSYLIASTVALSRTLD